MLIPVSIAQGDLEYFYSPLDWMQSIVELTPPSPALNSSVPIYTPGWREAPWEWSVFPKSTAQCPQPGLKPEPLDLVSSKLEATTPQQKHTQNNREIQIQNAVHFKVFFLLKRLSISAYSLGVISSAPDIPNYPYRNWSNFEEIPYNVTLCSEIVKAALQLCTKSLFCDLHSKT